MDLLTLEVGSEGKRGLKDDSQVWRWYMVWRWYILLRLRQEQVGGKDRELKTFWTFKFDTSIAHPN